MKMPVGITRFVGNLTLQATKHGPTIAIGVGCVGVVAACVLACKNTPKAASVIDEMTDNLEKAKSENKDEKKLKKQVFDIYKTSAIELIKLYGPAVLIGTASLGSIIFAHHVMVRRVATLSTMYATLDSDYKNLSKQFIDYIREKGDDHIATGAEEAMVEVEEVDETTGETVKQQVKGYKQVRKPTGYSPYAVCFDDNCFMWQDNASVNLNMLKLQETYCTNKLRQNGHLFLNEVFDALGMPRTSTGAKVGWFIGKGDDYVSFNLDDFRNAAFLGGWEPSVWLDFNVCGVIWDLI